MISPQVCQENLAVLFENFLIFSNSFCSSGIWLSYVAGEVIISESPYVSVPNKNKESPQSKCEWCFSSTNLKKCSACHVVWYCSSKCQVKWNNWNGVKTNKNDHKTSLERERSHYLELKFKFCDGIMIFRSSCIVCGKLHHLSSISEVGLEVAFCGMPSTVESWQGKSEITHAIHTFDGETLYTAKARKWEGEWVFQDSDCSTWVYCSLAFNRKVTNY